MGKQKNKFKESPQIPFKLKIRIGNKPFTPKRSNVAQSEEIESEDDGSFQVNLEEEIIENEEDVVADELISNCSNEEEFQNNDDEEEDDDDDDDKSENGVNNYSDNETSQANSECVNDNNDEYVGGDDNDEENDEDDDDDDDENVEENETANEYSQNDDEDDDEGNGMGNEEDDDDDDEYINDINNNKNNKKKLNKKEQNNKQANSFKHNKSTYSQINNSNSNSNKNDEEEYDDDSWLNDDEDVDYKKYKSAHGLTVRQRALFHGEKVEDLLELSTSQRVVELSEEQMLKRRRKAMRRRQLAEEKDEKDKRSILDKLLKKQDSKMRCQKNDSSSKNTGTLPSCTTSTKTSSTKQPLQPLHNHLRITHNLSGTTISLPPGWDFPIAKASYVPPKDVIKCGVQDCGNNKRYNCSRTNTPLCSLQCYKKNLLTVSSSSS